MVFKKARITLQSHQKYINATMETFPRMKVGVIESDLLQLDFGNVVSFICHYLRSIRILAICRQHSVNFRALELTRNCFNQKSNEKDGNLWRE